MEKYFVPSDRALKLKELGFDEKCIKVWFPNPNIGKNEHRLINSDTFLTNQTSSIEKLMTKGYFTNTFYAPLYQQAFEFFREKYKLDYVILPTKGSYGNYTIDIYKNLDNEKSLYWNCCYNTYEEAQLACLDKLIEICEKSSVS